MKMTTSQTRALIEKMAQLDFEPITSDRLRDLEDIDDDATIAFDKSSAPLLTEIIGKPVESHTAFIISGGRVELVGATADDNAFRVVMVFGSHF